MDFADLVAESVPPLRVVRVARGFSQKQLEALAGVPETVVSHYEAGRRVPDPATKWRLADALDVPVDMIFPDGQGR
jgi:transcriptional regulator with XRE-family HTH domain